MKRRRTPAEKAELRRKRRELRKKGGVVQKRPADIIPERTPQEDIQFWAGVSSRAYAMRILNPIRERPYWLSIKQNSGIPPVCGYFPTTMFSREGRWYYGFVFREHRDRVFKQWRQVLNARKELTGSKDSPLL